MSTLKPVSALLEAGPMSLRILVADDFEPWRRFVFSTLQKVGLRVTLEVRDGLEAVHKAKHLRPDLILLDIGLPTLNGIKAASRIRDVSPDSKILFLSEESSPEVAEAALEAGGAGYVVKSDAGRELLAAVKALSEGKRYISARLGGQVFFAAPDDAPEVFTRHELQVYSTDASFLEGFTEFIANGLNAGNAVVVLATEAHRHGLIQKLETRAFDLDAMIKCGSYISIDAGQVLSSFMIDDQPDPNQLENTLSNLVETASKAPNGATRRVCACGECASLLWVQGKLHAALRVEELWDQAAQRYGLSTLCGYLSEDLHGEETHQTFRAICSVHSTVVSERRDSMALGASL